MMDQFAISPRVAAPGDWRSRTSVHVAPLDLEHEPADTFEIYDIGEFVVGDKPEDPHVDPHLYNETDFEEYEEQPLALAVLRGGGDDDPRVDDRRIDELLWRAQTDNTHL